MHATSRSDLTRTEAHGLEVEALNHSASRGRQWLIWPVVGVAFGALARVNPFYGPDVTLEVGAAVWVADMLLVLILSLHPFTARAGVLMAGLFLAVPCFLRALPVYRLLLMGSMGLAFALAALQLVPAPGAGFRGRMAYVFTWLGTREVTRRARRFEAASLLQFVVAALVFAAAAAVVKAVSPSGIWWSARWLAGGILLLASAEMATAGHYFLTGLLGVNAPAWMRSPYLSASIREFWAERWNPAASALVFGRCFFVPLARRGAGLALFAAFLASAVLHVLLFYMGAKRWGIALMCGAFFLVQPLFMALERRLKVRRWRSAAGRGWTLAVLAVTSPLIVEPVLQFIEPSWGTRDQVLLPTLRVIGLVVVINVLYSLGALASASSEQ